MPNPKDISILSKWLEEKLKEYFVRKSRREVYSSPFMSSWMSTDSPFVSKSSKRVPIQAAISDFRILDLQLEVDQDDTTGDERNHINSAEDDEILKMPFKTNDSAYKTYEQGNSHAYVVYQNGSQCVGRELLLHLHTAKLDNLELVDPIPKYILSLDEHQIDVYTKVFPLLKDWAKTQNVYVEISVPECYYGCYQMEETSKASLDTDGAEEETDIFLDDIMSKVAAGLKYYERAKRSSGNSTTTVTKSSYRLLILHDVARHGFEMRNVEGSTFIPLLNVEEALKSLAEIHSTSWAFSEMTGKSFSRTWPFLVHPLYLPYIRERVIPGYFTMVSMVHDYLTSSGREDKDVLKRIMKRLIKLRLRLDEILEGSQHPRTVKCLIHQDITCSNLLFRYSFLQNNSNTMAAGDQAKMRKSCCDKDNQETDCSTPIKARRDCLDKRLKREVMIINWRTASFGSPMIDVAFLLLTGLPPKTRQAETGALLKIYWNAFRAYARKFGLAFGWSDKELYEDYLESLLYTCVLITGNIRKECKVDDNGMEAFLEAVKDLIAAGVM